MSLDLSYEKLSRASERAAKLFTEIYCQLESRPVDPGVTRAEMKEMFANLIGDRGVGLDQALDDFSKKVLPFAMGTPHPLYFGLVNSSPLPAGPLADLLVSALNNNGGAFHQSPSITATEQEVIREFGRLCGYGDGVSGMILPGGTFANLQGLLLARNSHFPQWANQGPLSLSGQPILYCSDVTHFCNDRAAMVLGIGQQGVSYIQSHARGVIDLEHLERQIISDQDAGRLPFAVVANGGTTGTGAMDDIDSIADICQRFKLWLHVDACYGGGALLLEPGLSQLKGIHRADSIAIDPHKWFFVPMTAGLLLTPHHDVECEAFEIAASYIPGDEIVDAFRRGIPTSRRSSGLTIWMILRAHGWNVIRDAVQRNVDLTRYVEELLRKDGFHVLEGGQLSVACARWEPPGLNGTAIDELQSKIAAAVISSGRAWFSTVKHDNKIWLRLNLVNIHTKSHHVDTLAGLIGEFARKLAN